MGNGDSITRAVPIVEVLRGDIVEDVHWGHVIVSTTSGALPLSIGDPGRVVPGGGCLSPFQVLPILLEGLDQSRGLTPLEVATAVGSNSGHELQKEAVLSLLRRAFLTSEALLCGRSRSEQSRISHPCSGKHAAWLLFAQSRGADSSTYLDVGSAVQQRVLTELLKLTRQIRSEVPVVTDTCGCPVACLSLDRIAALYAYLAHPPSAGSAFSSALTRLVSAVRAHPECLSGDGSFDTEVARATAGSVLSRTGPGGIACAALVEQRMGVTVKVESGGHDLARGVLATVLAHLKVLPAEYADSLVRVTERSSRVHGASTPVRFRFRLSA